MQDILDTLIAQGVHPELAGVFAVASVIVAKVLYPLAKASPIPRALRSPAVYAVVTLAGALVAHLDGLPLVWGVSTTLTAAATAMMAHDTMTHLPGKEK